MPWAPSEHDQSGNIIMQGLQLGSQNAQTLAGWLTNFIEQQKQISAGAKSADYFLDANPGAREEMGIHPDAWKNMGARDKIAAVQGYLQGKTEQRTAAAARGAAAELGARMNVQQAQADWLNHRAQVQGEEPEAGAKFGDTMLELLNKYGYGAAPGGAGAPAMPMPAGVGLPPGVGTMPPLPGGAALRLGTRALPPLPAGVALSPAAGTGPGRGAAGGAMRPMPLIMLEAVSKMGATNPRLSGVMMRQLLPSLLQNPGGMESAPVPTWTRGPTGRYAVTMPGSKQFQLDFDPSTWTRAMADGSIPAVPITDPSGNVLGNVYPDQRGNLHPTGKPVEPAPLPQSFYAAYHGNGIIPGLAGKLQNAQDTVDMTDKEIKAIHGPAGGTSQEIRDRAAKQIPALKGQLQDLFRLYQTQGYGAPDTWASLYAKHDLTNPAESQAGQTPGGANKAPSPATPSDAAYKTPSDVTAAYRAGRLTREDATGILRSKFKLN